MKKDENIKLQGGKQELISLTGSSPKATTKGGSGHTSTALLKNIASPRDPALFDGKEVAERERNIRKEKGRGKVVLVRGGKPVYLTPMATKLSVILSTSLNDNDPDIAEFIRWTERAEEFGIKEVGEMPNLIARTFSLKELSKRMYKGLSKKKQIQQVRDLLKQLRETEQVMTLGKQGVKITSSLIMREYAVEDITPEERGLDEERIVFGTIFLWNLKKRFNYISPKALDMWGSRGSGTENFLFSILLSTLHSICYFHQKAAEDARKNLKTEIKNEHKGLSPKERDELYKEREEERVTEALTYSESVEYLKSRIPSDYDSTKQLRYKFTMDFKTAVKALIEIGIITQGYIAKGKGKRGQDMAVFKFSESYKEQKVLPDNSSE